MSESEESDKSLRTKIQELEREMNLLPQADDEELETILANTRLVFDQSKLLFNLMKEAGDEIFVHNKCINGQFEIISEMQNHINTVHEQLDEIINISREMQALNEHEIQELDKKYSLIVKVGVCFQIISILAIIFK